MCPSSVYLSVTLSPPKPLGRIWPKKFSTLLPFIVRVCESNIIFLCIHLSVCPSVRHIISFKTTRRNSTKLATSLALRARVCKSNIIFLCVCPSIIRPSICPSCYLLLNPLAEFNRTCYISSPHCKGVREQHYFFVHPLSIHLCITLSSPITGWNSTKLTTSLSPHWKEVWEQHQFSLHA